MSKVKVNKKDLLRVIAQADERTQWNTSSWKARKRLLDAVSEESEKPSTLTMPQAAEIARDLWDYCAIPNCYCPGDVSHP